MKVTYLLPLGVVAGAWLVPDPQLMNEVVIEDHHDARRPSLWDRFSFKDSVKKLKGEVKAATKAAEATFDDILATAEYSSDHLVHRIEEGALYVNKGLKDLIGDRGTLGLSDDDERPHPPPGKRPHHPPGHRKPHHPPHHGKPNETIYQMISKSKYTTKLAELINEFDDLVELLNSTKSNSTIFAPTDYAFSKIPDDAPEPSKEFLKKVLLYHVAPGLYPAGKVLFDHTIPTAFEEPLLQAPQRISARLSLKGVALNFYSHVVAANIPATNGIIHGIDSLLLPPPTAVQIIQYLPQEFSTLTLGLTKTGLLDVLNKTDAHVGGTLFAPSNGAFRKLGPKINAFLFSKVGEPYLKALLAYHVVANQTLYSTALVNKTATTEIGPTYQPGTHTNCPHMSNAEADASDSHPPHPPQRYFHFDLPTLFHGRTLSVDIARFGPFVRFKVNGFVRVAVKDGVAKDGVIQLVSDVLIPPRKFPGPPGSEEELDFWNGEELELEDFKERLLPTEGSSKVIEGGQGTFEL